jgi:hypothetical protein
VKGGLHIVFYRPWMDCRWGAECLIRKFEFTPSACSRTSHHKPKLTWRRSATTSRATILGALSRSFARHGNTARRLPTDRITTWRAPTRSHLFSNAYTSGVEFEEAWRRRVDVRIDSSLTLEEIRAKGREDWLKLRQQQTRENSRDPQDRSADRDQDARPDDLSGSPDKGLDDDLN